jgi:hypothetical protein
VTWIGITAHVSKIMPIVPALVNYPTKESFLKFELIFLTFTKTFESGLFFRFCNHRMAISGARRSSCSRFGTKTVKNLNGQMQWPSPNDT